jgi:hypothetical protein
MGMSPDHAHIYGELLPEFEGEYRAAYARRDPKIVYPETNIALKELGSYLSKSSPEFQKAALVVLEAHVRAYDDMNKRQRGEIIPTPVMAERSANEWGPKLSEALASWAAGGSAHNASKPSGTSRSFMGICGLARLPARKPVSFGMLSPRCQAHCRAISASCPYLNC